jgi:hypothetical protein
MREFFKIQLFKNLSFAYIAVVLFLAIVVLVNQSVFYEIILRTLSLPLLLILYYLVSPQRSLWYIIALIFASISNVLFVFNDSLLLNYGLFAFLLFRGITIYLVLKATKKKSVFAIFVGSIFFLFPLLYFIALTQDSLGQSFYISLVNVILISFLGGISLSNYLLEEGFKHTWLLLSTLLFAFLVFLFVIQKYYLYIPVFQPIRVLVLMAAHYFFMIYRVIHEREVQHLFLAKSQ